jgi:hypothetical protein
VGNLLLTLVLDLFWGGVDLLLSLLSSTTKTKDKMEGRLLLDVVVRKSTAVLELLSSEDQSLLIWGNPLLILNLGLDLSSEISICSYYLLPLLRIRLKFQQPEEIILSEIVVPLSLREK